LRKLLVYGLLAMLLVSVYAGVAAARGHSGYPLDDAWIHQTYARNWAATGQLAYVPGVPSAGSTAPLWTLLLSAAYRLNVDPYLWTTGLGALWLAICAWLLSRLSERLLPNRSPVSWLVGLGCVLEWHLIWAAASGMETLLFIALGLGLIDRVWANASGWLIGALGGLLILARPEGLLLLVLILGAQLVRSGRSNRRRLAQEALAFLSVLAPGLYFNLQAGGAIFPNTFYAKQSEYAELLQTLPRWLDAIGKMLVAPLAGPGVLLIPGLIAWITSRMRSHMRWREEVMVWIPVAWAGLHVGVYALRLPVAYQHGRYLLPIIPVLILYGGVGTALVADWLKARRSQRWARLLRTALLAILIVLWGLFVPIGAGAYAADVDVIEREMVAVARWLEANVPSGAVVAAHDIGALGYFAPRPLLDLAGLISPEVIPFIRDETQLNTWLHAKGAQYLVTFPNWYPQLTAQPRLTMLYAGDSPYSPEHFTVYRITR
jgi:hypothetical protein